MGVRHGQLIINRDILRYQAAVSNVVTSGIAARFPNRPMIVEVGGSYGGLALQFSRAFNARCVLIDNPEMLFVAGAYLIQNAPDKSIAYTADLDDWDFLLLPDFAISSINGINGDLFVSLMSLQEMTTAQIHAYLAFAQRNFRFFYGENFYRTPDNTELPETVEMLACQYFQLFPPREFYNRDEFGEAFKGDSYQQLKTFVGIRLGDAMQLPDSAYVRILGGERKVMISDRGCPVEEEASLPNAAAVAHPSTSDNWHRWISSMWPFNRV